MGDDEGGVDYEIEMGDEEAEAEAPADLEPVDDEEGEEEVEGGEEEEEEVEQLDEKIAVGTGMSVGNHRNPKTGGSIGAAENPKSLNESARLVSETTKKYNTLLTEAKKLKSENEQFRGALKEFRNKLVETVVFNSNLTYVTRLFMEHSTTKGEKQSIIKRFDDEVTNLKESKKLYKTIATQLENRKPISESVENKIIKEATTSSSKQLNESTAYVDPSTKRILDLINRVEKK
jgi:myosin heavy subunit